MSMENNKNQSAFPMGYGTDKYERDIPGMTLRQYYAGLAMQGLLAKYNLKTPEDQKIICQLSFELADEMCAY